jgi:hypothetical protein
MWHIVARQYAAPALVWHIAAQAHLQVTTWPQFAAPLVFAGFQPDTSKKIAVVS